MANQSETALPLLLCVCARVPRRYSVPSFRGAQLTEIIMLDWISELDYLYLHIHRPGLRCGPRDRLISCTRDEPAMLMQNEVCNRPMEQVPTTLQLLQQSGCSMVHGHAVI